MMQKRYEWQTNDIADFLQLDYFCCFYPNKKNKTKKNKNIFSLLQSNKESSS